MPYEQRLFRYLGPDCSSMLMRQSAILNEVSIHLSPIEHSPEMTVTTSSQYPAIISPSTEEISMEQLELKLIREVKLWLDSLS